MYILYFAAISDPLHWGDLELCTRDGWLIANLQWSQLHQQRLLLSPDLGCSDLVHQKNEKMKCENCFGNRTVLLHETDLELCTRHGWLKADPQWSWLHLQSLFLILDLWDAKTWSTKKKKKKKRRRVWKLLQKQDCLAVLKDLELCIRDRWLKADPQWRQLYPQSLFLSSDLRC